ncbi:MAG: YbdD/YjiX family protein [Nitrosomonadales bacterium]|jgi:uncharacterized short protein YbdD (DUF466 family)|nr:MAG: YbdD/YjiX family protein [Nitrosomonadales bacterium]
MKSITMIARHTWQIIRTISGDDAYERYLVHWHKYHANEGGQPLDCKTFFKAEQTRKWDGVRRCC